VAYNNFTLETVKSQFNLTIVSDRFCDSLPTVEPQLRVRELKKLNQSY
jgi:hypothetical protein